jgi:very-short-patch-repair endonuclease
MKKITQGLLEKEFEKALPFVEAARKEGMDEGRITDAIRHHADLKIRGYYKKPDFATIGQCLDLGKLQADSKIEQIFYDILIVNEIPFQFQVSIGRYRADYLIHKFLVVEIDGPRHEKEKDERRDNYMRKMGYKILRVPTWLLCMDSKAVIKSIKEIIYEKAGLV